MVEHMLKNGRVLRIDTAAPEDAGALVDYMKIIGGESDNLTFGANECRFSVQEEAAYLARLAEQPTSRMIIGRIDGEIAGTAVVTGDTRVRMRHNADLGISVRKPYWRQGIGALLMRALLDFARQTGTLRILHLTVRTDNVGAIALYERLGFERVGVHRAYIQVSGAYFDMDIMELHL